MADFAQWPPQEPPPGFADRVLAARRRQRHARRWLAGAAAAAACAALALAAVPSAVSGAAEPQERRSLALGRRGVAVAEPGSRLRWSVSRGGAARVVQERGAVFYRVEPGAQFEVDAAGAHVVVTGTCFQIEVIPMPSQPSRMLVSAAAGAAAASAVLVTVYEGRVRVTSAGGGAEVGPGEHARSEPGGPPRVEKPPEQLAPAAPEAAAAHAQAAQLPSRAPHAQLVETERKQRAQIAALQARVGELERERTALAARAAHRPSEEDAPEGPAGLPPRNKYRDFTPAELQAMAQNCEVRVDLPPLEREPYKMSPDTGARLHLSDGEQSQVAAALNQVRKDALARLRALYLESGGDAAGADAMEPDSLVREILHKSPRPQVDAARARVARERAGLDPPPANPDSGTIAERYFRYMITVADSLQRALEPPLGAQQAGRIRDALTVSRMNMSGCNDPQR